jgi:hypothetical protein
VHTWPLLPELTPNVGIDLDATEAAVTAVRGHALLCGRLAALWVLQDALHAASEHLHLAQQAMQQPAQPAAPAQQQQQQQQ